MSNDTNHTGYPSVDKPWLKYYTEDDLRIEVPKCTIYQNIYEQNKNYSNDIAINYYGNKMRYAKLFSKTESCAKSLRQIGIKRGDCVTLCTAGVPEAIYIVLACSRIGAIANFINPMFTTEQMTDRINDTEAEWIFILDEMYSYIEKALPKTCIGKVVIIPATNSVQPIAAKALYLKSKARKILSDKIRGKQDYLSWKEFINLGKVYTGIIDLQYEPDTPTVMVYSSGTTGASKGILLTNDGINATIANYQTEQFHYERYMTMLQTIPIWFSTGIVLSMLMPITNGVAVILEPQFSKETFVKDILKYKPSVCLTATSLWMYVMEVQECKNADLSNFIYPFTGGEKISGRDENRLNIFLKEHGCKQRLYKGYGMCELGSTVSTFGDAVEYESKHGGTGYPMLNSMVSAFDINTDRELKYREHGEIRVCSPARMKEYYKNPEATAEFFKTDENGNVWGCTGDIGYVDEDGEVFICGRAIDAATLKTGERIYLFDIEDVIFEDENVVQCKVVDIDTPDGTELAAHIVFREDADNSDQALSRIHELLAAKLPAPHVPRYYKSRASMPVHSNGKRDIEALRQDREGCFKVEEVSNERREETDRIPVH